MELGVDDIDAGLAEAARPADADGVEQLLERYGPPAYRLALRITGVTEDAEDVVARALQAAADMIRTLPDEAAIESRIYRAIARAAYQKVRDASRRGQEIALADVRPPLDGDGHFAPMDDWSKRVNEPALRGPLRHVVSEALDALPAVYRTALVLHDVEGVSTPDIADILGVDVPAVPWHVHRARLFVRKCLAEHFESARRSQAPMRRRGPS
jgi:RNA polymerase sigma-70 factor, ECF subfamily